ncbi:integral membrane protein [Corallococcus sp. CAG:1435]|nr:integral membrane protein [Corallococcus sp. CAG:1435]
MKHFEEKLPENYRLVKTVDATKAPFAVVFNLLSLVMMVGAFAVLYFAFGTDVSLIKEQFLTLPDFTKILALLLFVVGFIVYIVLHELVHGVVYKAFTKRKLTFGVTMTCAYCGVPDVFVYRTASLCALLAPFVIFSIAFIVPMFFLQNTVWFLLLAALFAMHFGGCVGDIYITVLYVFKFRDGKTLMRDTGPVQTFYLPHEKS